jgi:hypothetical protein
VDADLARLALADPAVATENDMWRREPETLTLPSPL